MKKEMDLRSFYEGKYLRSSSRFAYKDFVGKLRFILNPIKMWISQAVPANSLVLDLGCGGGAHAYLKSKNCEIVGSDISRMSLEVTKDVYDHVVLADARSLPFRNDAFDTLISTDLLEHIQISFKDKVCTEIKRVLKYGGVSVHHIALLSAGPLSRWAAKHAGRFKSNFVDKIGHYGLEYGDYELYRFRKYFGNVKWRSYYLDPFWDLGEYSRMLEGYEGEKMGKLASLLLRIVISIANNTQANEIGGLVFTAITMALGRIYPLKCCHSILIRGIRYT